MQGLRCRIHLRNSGNCRTTSCGSGNTEELATLRTREIVQIQADGPSCGQSPTAFFLNPSETPCVARAAGLKLSIRAFALEGFIRNMGFRMTSALYFTLRACGNICSNFLTSTVSPSAKKPPQTEVTLNSIFASWNLEGNDLDCLIMTLKC